MASICSEGGVFMLPYVAQLALVCAAAYQMHDPETGGVTWRLRARAGSCPDQGGEWCSLALPFACQARGRDSSVPSVRPVGRTDGAGRRPAHRGRIQPVPPGPPLAPQSGSWMILPNRAGCVAADTRRTRSCAGMGVRSTEGVLDGLPHALNDANALSAIRYCIFAGSAPNSDFRTIAELAGVRETAMATDSRTESAAQPPRYP